MSNRSLWITLAIILVAFLILAFYLGWIVVVAA